MESTGPCVLCYYQTVNNDTGEKVLYSNGLAFQPGLEYLWKKYKINLPDNLCLQCIRSTFKHKCYYDENIVSQTRTYFCKHCEKFLCNDCAIIIQKDKDDTRQILKTSYDGHRINPGNVFCRSGFREQVLNHAPYHRQMDLGDWRRTYFVLALNCPQPVIEALSRHWPSSTELTHLEETLKPPYWSETLEEWIG